MTRSQITSQFRLYVHTAFLHADVDQDLFAEPPEPDEWYDERLKEDEVWKLNKALYGYRKAPKLWHKHLVNVLESLSYHPLLTDPSCFRHDETNTNIFVHVDDGLMVGPKNEVLKLVELLSKQVLMRIAGRMEKTGDKIYFLGRVIERTARGYSVEANPKYIQNVINVLGLEEAKPVMTPSVKRTPTTESLVELEGERRAMYRTVVGKLLYMCQERADVMYSVKETARKITCPTESDEMNPKRIVRYLKGAPSAGPFCNGSEGWEAGFGVEFGIFRAWRSWLCGVGLCCQVFVVVLSSCMWSWPFWCRSSAVGEFCFSNECI